MSKKEINVDLETITPLWTGDAWQKNTEIRPSSLMGSLRFWLEVICYFVLKKDFDSKKGRFEEEVNQDEFKKKLKSNSTDVKSQIETLIEMNIPVPSIIFGTTGWRGLIEIKEIKPLYDYCFGNKLNLPYAAAFTKSQLNQLKEFNDKEELNYFINNFYGKNFKDKDKNFKSQWSAFYFPNPYFYGEFTVKFLVEEEILDSIFYPLLNFMDKYGYWGGKWNIGYGRLKVKGVREGNNTVKWGMGEFNLGFINNSNNNFNLGEYLNEVNKFEDLTKNNNNGKSIKMLSNQISNSDFKDIIKNLIKIKANERAQHKNRGGSTEERHKIFGTIEAPPYKDSLPQGSKILPYITKGEQGYCGGFLSIVDLL
ncbi:MAG: CRISPR-associated protein Cmr1 [Thermoanaerobacter sp.]|nr:CRISPR-associated protein Cmr1 [Thermoanaerobacter sp.]